MVANTQSIYPECVSSEITDGTLKLEIPIEFDVPRKVCLVQDGTLATSSTSDADDQLILFLSSLPPLMISMILPPSYPLNSPPCLVSVRAIHLWMPYINRLKDLLTNMWQPGEGVLYNWIEFIRNGEFLSALLPPFHPEESEFRYVCQVNNTCAVLILRRIPHPSPRILATILKDSEAALKSIQFTQNSYPCSICLSSLKGSKCIQLSCNHVFCRPCLEDFWKMCIAEGDVSRVGCPDPECVKEKREADAQEVARIVTEAEMERWRWLKEKKNLEAGKLRNEYLHCLQKMANAHRRSFDRTLSYGFLPNCNLQANRCG